MNPTEPSWTLIGFLEHLDTWIGHESPKQDLRVIVTDWVLSRSVDPYKAAQREAGFANLRFARIPNTFDGAGSLIVRSYFVEETTTTVRCSNIATLTWPV